MASWRGEAWRQRKWRNESAINAMAAMKENERNIERKAYRKRGEMAASAHRKIIIEKKA
jgi:hypothetical protein